MYTEKDIHQTDSISLQSSYCMHGMLLLHDAFDLGCQTFETETSRFYDCFKLRKMSLDATISASHLDIGWHHEVRRHSCIVL